jgi:hypothetical protein
MTYYPVMKEIYYVYTEMKYGYGYEVRTGQDGIGWIIKYRELVTSRNT